MPLKSFGVTSLFRFFLMACVLGMLGIACGLLGSLLLKTASLFSVISPISFLFGTTWAPVVTTEGICSEFGVLPILMGTILVSSLTLLIVGPIGIWAATYLAEYTSHRWHKRIKTILELFAGIPMIVYGLFATMILAPLLQHWGTFFNITVAPESAVVLGIVMGVMSFPFVVCMADDIFHAIPLYLRQAGWALGSTHSEVIRRIVLPASLPGLLAVFLLTLARSIGETIIVVMAASLTANLTLNPLHPTTTVTAQITSLLTGDQSPDSPKTQAAFALGLLLFSLTLLLNMLATRTVRKYKTRYTHVF